MTEEEVRGLFMLAGFVVKRLLRLPNGYIGTQEPLTDVDLACDAPRVRAWMSDYRWRAERPAWFVKTAAGWIEIGWRKRVISIDWHETGYRGEITRDDVMQDVSGVHAYSREKAVEYLRTLRERLAVTRRATLRDSVDDFIVRYWIERGESLSLDDLHILVRRAVTMQMAVASRAPSDEYVAAFEQMAFNIAASSETKAQSQVEWEITEAQKSAYALGLAAASRAPSQPDAAQLWHDDFCARVLKQIREDGDLLTSEETADIMETVQAGGRSVGRRCPRRPARNRDTPRRSVERVGVVDVG